MSILKEQLLDKINNKTAKVGVVGLGYVGLPLAVEKASAGYQTIGFDVQDKKVNMVNDGQNYIGEVVDEKLKELVAAGTLKATTDFSFVKDVDTICICVPTPLDLYKQPDLSYVVSSTESVAQYLHKGMLIILESTTYPGTTEEVLKPILEKSGLKCGEDFFLAFSPERVDPGNKHYNTKNTPKVVGFTGKALDVAKKTLTIKAGKKATIKAATMPNSKVTYKTSNKKVATVTNKGVVKGVKKGKAVITVKANGKTVKVKITVK